MCFLFFTEDICWRKSMKGKMLVNVEITPALLQISIWRRKLFLEENHVNAACLTKSSWITHPITGTPDVTLDTSSLSIRNTERSHINVAYVGEPSATSSALKIMKELTTERNPINVRNVGKPSCGSKPFRDTWSHTLQILLTDARCVRKPLVLQLLFRHVREPTLERSPISVKTVVKPSCIPVNFKYMKKVTAQRNRMNVGCVERLSNISSL